MQAESRMNFNNNDKVRKALVVDGDNDRYRRKERTGLLQQAGFKVFPVLKIEHARARCKPGAFDFIAVIGGENANLAIEFCDEIQAKDSKQQILMVTSDRNLPSREYIVHNWDELMSKVGIASGTHSDAPQDERALTAA